MVPEDLLFWIAPLADSPVGQPGVLCARHADAMVVPLGWTLDDRRESALRLFKPRPIERPDPSPRRAARRSQERGDGPEQLQIDGTGEIPRPSESASTQSPSAERPSTGGPTSWEPEFDHDDDLNGLLEVTSPLLSRAFRGTERRRR